MPVPSLRLRLIGVFVVSALVVAAVIVIAVDRFSAEQLMELMMDGSDSPEEAQLMFDEYVGRVLLIGAAVAVVLGSLTALWFLRRVLRPLDQLAEATRAVAGGDFGARVAPPPDPELRALADAFNQMSASLERAETLRRALVEDVAHELRTPLTTLRGYTEGLADGVVEPTPAMLRTLHEEIERLTRLVEELDRLSRGADASDGGQRTSLQLAPIVARAVELVRPELTRRGVTVDFLADPDLPAVLAHPDDIAKVISNLVQNAERYTDDGGTIEIRLDHEHGAVRGTIVNSGSSIPADELPLIWERFHRVDRSRSRASGGAGIGLAIVRQVVEAHGGHVGARSAAGRTEVWFSLPAA